MNIHRWFLTSLVAMGACSPYDYSKQVGEFDKTVNGLTTSVVAGHQSLIDDSIASARRDLIYNQRHVTFSAGCRERPGVQSRHDSPCFVRRIGSKTEADDPDPVGPRLEKILTALRGYTAGLAAVTKASDRKDFDSAVADLSKQVDALVAAGGVAPLAAPMAAAAINQFGWLVGTALDQQRYEALRDAVNRVARPGPHGEKPMQAIANELSAKLITLTDERR